MFCNAEPPIEEIPFNAPDLTNFESVNGIPPAAFIIFKLFLNILNTSLTKT